MFEDVRWIGGGVKEHWGRIGGLVEDRKRVGEGLEKDRRRIGEGLEKHWRSIGGASEEKLKFLKSKILKSELNRFFHQISLTSPKYGNRLIQGPRPIDRLT